MIGFLRGVKMTVYIEYVFIDNFFIDLMLFKTAFKITGREVSRLRLITCSALGAVFALIYPLITDNALIITIAKILFGLLLTFSAAKFYSAKEYASFTAVFLGLTFFTGGAIIGAFSLFGIEYSSEISIAFMVLPVYILIRFMTALIRYFYRAKDLSGLVVKTEIVCGGKSVVLRGFFDTGNALYDGLTPVIVVSSRAVAPIITPALLKSAKRITVHTAVGTEKKISFKPDMLVIYSGEIKNIFYNVRVCVADKTFNGYDAILNLAFKEAKNERIAV